MPVEGLTPGLRAGGGGVHQLRVGISPDRADHEERDGHDDAVDEERAEPEPEAGVLDVVVLLLVVGLPDAVPELARGAGRRVSAGRSHPAAAATPAAADAPARSGMPTSGTERAGIHCAIPCVQTRSAALTCPLATMLAQRSSVTGPSCWLFCA